MLQIDTSNGILINWQDTGLKLSQRRGGTVIYTPERKGFGTINRVVKEPIGRDHSGVMQWDERVTTVNDTGTKYQEHKMPYARYSPFHDAPRKPGASYDPNVCAGAAQLEADVLDLLKKMNDKIVKGGRREGAGRPKAVPTTPVMIRLTAAQRLKFLELGGARWMKRMIDEQIEK